MGEALGLLFIGSCKLRPLAQWRAPIGVCDTAQDPPHTCYWFGQEMGQTIEDVGKEGKGCCQAGPARIGRLVDRNTPPGQ